MQKGDEVRLPAKKITQAMICRYADAADDHNPLHIDEEFAKTTRYGGTIAHGVLSMAFMQELMIKTFGLEWVKRGEILTSFLAPVRPGDEIVTIGKVASINEETQEVTLQVFCQNQNGEKVTSAKCLLHKI